MVSRTSTPRARVLLVASVLLAGLGLNTEAAPFTSIHVFGDGVSTTTDNVSPFPKYGKRYCNGRVWVEVLAEWQGLPYDEDDNDSYFGHDSTELLDSVDDFTAPADVATALVVVWVNNADLVEQIFATASNLPYNSGDLSDWADFIDDATADHETALTDLYNKGVRTIVLPRAVDITLAPRFEFVDNDSKTFVRLRVQEFNSDLKIMAEALESSLTGLTIHTPDTFSFLDDVFNNPADYGVGNPTQAAFLTEPELDGPGADYVWWDQTHPTAKVQMYLANLVHTQLCPPRITGISPVGPNTHLTLENIPLNRSGIIDGRSGAGAWQEDTTFLEPFSTGSTTATVIFPTLSDPRFHRARFPVNWVWP